MKKQRHEKLLRKIKRIGHERNERIAKTTITDKFDNATGRNISNDMGERRETKNIMR